MEKLLFFFFQRVVPSIYQGIHDDRLERLAVIEVLLRRDYADEMDFL
jgi:hypothetical protein